MIENAFKRRQDETIVVDPYANVQKILNDSALLHFSSRSASIKFRIL